MGHWISFTERGCAAHTLILWAMSSCLSSLAIAEPPRSAPSNSHCAQKQIEATLLGFEPKLETNRGPLVRRFQELMDADLHAGENARPRLILSAAPRMGKSTLLRELVSYWNAQPGGLAIHLDFEPWVTAVLSNDPVIRERYDFVRPRQFAELLFSAILESGGYRLSDSQRARYLSWRGVSEFSSLVAQANLPGLLEVVGTELRSSGFHPVLILDEPTNSLVRSGTITEVQVLPGGRVPPGVQSWNHQAGEVEFGFDPMESVAAQNAMPDVWVDPDTRSEYSDEGEVLRENAPSSLSQLTRLNQARPPSVFTLLPESRESVINYLSRLRAHQSTHFSDEAIDVILAASEGRPLNIRLIVENLPRGITEVTRDHVVRAVARARSQRVLLSTGRGEERTSDYIRAHPDVESQDAGGRIDWQTQLSARQEISGNVPLGEIYLNFLRQSFEQPGISIFETEARSSAYDAEHSLERADRGLHLRWSVRESQDSPNALAALFEDLGGDPSSGLEKDLARLLKQVGTHVSYGFPEHIDGEDQANSLAARFLVAARSNNFQRGLSLLRQVLPERRIVLHFGQAALDTALGRNSIRQASRDPSVSILIMADSHRITPLERAWMNRLSTRRMRLSVAIDRVFYGQALRAALPAGASISEEGIEFLYERSRRNWFHTLQILRNLPSDLIHLSAENLRPVAQESGF